MCSFCDTEARSLAAPPESMFDNTSEPCPSTRAQRTERPVARNGCYHKRVRMPNMRICTWNHGASENRQSRPPHATNDSMRRKEPPAMGRTLPTLKRAWPKDGPLAAICVQSVDVQCVLQFTLIHAAGCVLHRRTSRVIHRLKLFSFLQNRKPRRAPTSEGSRQHKPSKHSFNHKCVLREVTKKKPGGRRALEDSQAL